ncbi:MAG: hypothetical protein HY525_10185 [Betaproteobacteria bacterium]|nr:hypothetical protein [Betaproteobacteria bacterium]
MTRITVTLALGALLWLMAVVAAHGQSAPESAYTEVFYSSGGLRIQA